jgi:photosystem II stability/assembly factor-like uncharacterized protein
MKHIIFLIVVLFCVNAVNSQNNYWDFYQDCNLFIIKENYNALSPNGNPLPPWNFIQTATTSQITDIQYSGFFNCWATHTSMGLVLTTNNGTNWLSISFYDSNFTTSYNGVHFINSQTGWAVGGAMQIRKTTNGGFNWVRQIPPPVAGVLNAVYFFDQNTGLAIGRKTANFNSCILRTTNGGTDWYEVIASASNENELSGQFWLNSSTGWICGKNILLKSTNGGLNYTNYYSNIPPTVNGQNALLCIYFENFNTGWIGGSNLDHKNIYKTTNAGANWIFQDNPVAQYIYSQINDICFIDNNRGWAAHGTPSSGTILYTSNSGVNWVVDDNTNTWFDCLWTVNDAWVYCGAGGGKIWYTGIPSSVKKLNENLPEKFLLSQNYPNPFNQSTMFNVKCSMAGVVKVCVYDISGKEVATLVNEKLQAGTYEVKWNAGNLPSGVYYYKLTAGDYSEVRKMILIK